MVSFPYRVNWLKYRILKQCALALIGLFAMLPWVVAGWLKLWIEDLIKTASSLNLF